MAGNQIDFKLLPHSNNRIVNVHKNKISYLRFGLLFCANDKRAASLSFSIKCSDTHTEYKYVDKSTEQENTIKKRSRKKWKRKTIGRNGFKCEKKKKIRNGL